MEKGRSHETQRSFFNEPQDPAALREIQEMARRNPRSAADASLEIRSRRAQEKKNCSRCRGDEVGSDGCCIHTRSAGKDSLIQ